VAALKIGLSPLQGQASFEETMRECERAEAAGFDSIWLGEHHNNPILYPAPLIGLAAVASRTHSIRLGTGVLRLPLYHPVMVAEEGAMVDMISGGRLILGIGAGYAPEALSQAVPKMPLERREILLFKHSRRCTSGSHTPSSSVLWASSALSVSPKIELF
jgi:alkanesulfonate monooxygenase SsuD/methylene tetrahydromethanopterin reductase-like flavin-dependent oxidoreductase (luciferase family)